jgi:hypothetical protein
MSSGEERRHDWCVCPSTPSFNQFETICPPQIKRCEGKFQSYTFAYLYAEDMQQDAIDCASQAIDKYPNEKDIASYIKKEFDKKYEPTWHCAVGRNFGSFVTHEAKTMVGILRIRFMLL